MSKFIRVTLSLTNEVKKILTEIADRERRSMSQIVRDAINFYNQESNKQ